MSNTRVKADTIAPPGSLEAAQALLDEIGKLDRAVAAKEALCETVVTGLKKRAAAEAAIINERIAARFRALQAYVEVNRDALIPKDRESAVWPTGTVGFRKTPLSVRIAKAKFDAIVAELRRRRLGRCLRVKTEIDKDDLKKVRAKVEDIEGVNFISRTEFFAKPTDVGIEHVAKVTPIKVTRSRQTPTRAALRKRLKWAKRAKPRRRAPRLLLDWRLVLMAVAVVALIAFARPASGQPCTSRADMLDHLAVEYRETPIAAGVTASGGLVELLVNPVDHSWTLILSTPNGQSCLLATGEGWRPAPRREDGPQA